MGHLIRTLAALGVAIILLAAADHYDSFAYVFGWWAACAWLLITKQWRPLA